MGVVISACIIVSFAITFLMFFLSPDFSVGRYQFLTIEHIGDTLGGLSLALQAANKIKSKGNIIQNYKQCRKDCACNKIGK